MKVLPVSNHRTMRHALCALAIFSLLATMSFATKTTKVAQAAQDDAPDVTQAVFSNPAAINCADRVSNNAGTNPGLPPLYPSTINVSGLAGTITKVTVTFAITSTFPDDLDVLLIGPTMARSLVMSDAGGSGDHTNVTYTFDQTAANLMPDNPTAVVPAGTYKPSNYVGLATPEPGGQDNFPAPGPGLMAYPTDFNIFNGTNPNGVWSLYVVDDQVIDNVSLPSGWSINITTAAPPASRKVDFDGDNKTDFGVVRASAATAQATWWIKLNSVAGTEYSQPWGLGFGFWRATHISGDAAVPEDYDGDGKTDIAVWRNGTPTNAYFHILQSSTNTLRSEQFGQNGDNPTVVDDYDGDGKADPAVYRNGAAGQPSFFFYRGSLNNPSGTITYVPWGTGGDYPAPGDYDGDGKADAAIYRSGGAGQGSYYILNSGTGTSSFVGFGTGTSNLVDRIGVVSGDFDGDNKTDLARVQIESGQLVWYIRSSMTGLDSRTVFGLSATDYPTPGDYDGDSKTDISIYRSGQPPDMTYFFWRPSSGGADQTMEWGATAGNITFPDYPVAHYQHH